jgi:hypothetical protein
MKNINQIYCFIHSCTLINNDTQILDYIITIIEKTGFIDIVEKVFINNVGIPIDNKYGNKKYIITNYPDQTYYYESITLNKIQLFSKENPNNYIIYLHTKGVSYNDCIKKLDEGYDTIGCNYIEASLSHPKHYSGNFWWGKTNYLSKLNKIENLNKQIFYKVFSEFWLNTKEPNLIITTFTVLMLIIIWNHIQ